MRILPGTSTRDEVTRYAAMSDPYHPDDTIAALASGPGPAERGIVRLSGPDVKDSVSRLFIPLDSFRWASASQPRRHPGVLGLPELTNSLPADLLLWPTARSYTGQPLAEIHHDRIPAVARGGLVRSVLSRECGLPSGVSSRSERFSPGRIDLLQAEAVLGVIDASDQQQLSVALGQLGGGLSSRFHQLHEELLLHLADLEAGLDFVEEDIEFISRDELLRRLDDGVAFLHEMAAQSSSRLQSTGRRKVVLAGLPNAGKSTLFNALIGTDRALVSDVAGTTRDYLSASLEWDGVALEVIDTAGWDRAVSGIGQSAGELRQEQWERADLVVWCTSCGATPREMDEDRTLRSAAERSGLPMLPVATKIDCDPERVPDDHAAVCALSGVGVADLRARIRQQLQQTDGSHRLIGSTSARCRDSLSGAAVALEQARAAATSGAGDEIVAIELRESIDHLGKIVGRVYTDDILDRIFSRFCIGK